MAGRAKPAPVVTAGSRREGQRVGRARGTVQSPEVRAASKEKQRKEKKAQEKASKLVSGRAAPLSLVREPPKVQMAKPSSTLPAERPQPAIARMATRGGAAPVGMGLGAIKSLKAPRTPLGDCDVGSTVLPPPNVACGSGAAIDFLKQYVVGDRNIRVVRAFGWTEFSRTVGANKPIPLASPALKPGAEGSLNIPEQWSFIVTDFVPRACVAQWGLPNAYQDVDPCALVGQVVFNLLQGIGGPALHLTTAVNAKQVSGVSFLGEHYLGFPALSQRIENNLSATYDVVSPPFPGFPDIVGVEVTGYLIVTQLIVDALEYAQRTGG